MDRSPKGSFLGDQLLCFFQPGAVKPPPEFLLLLLQKKAFGSLAKRTKKTPDKSGASLRVLTT